MDPKTRDQVFEPFFTTKEHGTGLGLSTVYGIVKQAGGAIHLWSEKGVGTSFDVYFPRVEEQVEIEAPVEPSVTAAGRETVLIVEDEAAVRRLMRAALENKGYRVLIAADGVEALKRISSHSGPLDLVITDLAMPGMNGTELARKVKERLPGIQVLCISGYAEEWRQSGEIDESSFLQKPFSPQVLSRKVREMLDRRERLGNQTSSAQ
jgi:CheY-like chemotaxis protein